MLFTYKIIQARLVGMQPGSTSLVPDALDFVNRKFSSIFGFVAVLFFVPETKALSLEELDQGIPYLKFMYRS